MPKELDNESAFMHIDRAMKNTFKAQYFGTRKDDNARITLTGPKWDCDWYWSFGYLGNRNEHYHLKGYQSKDHTFTTKEGELKHITEKRNKCMHDCLLADYDLNPKLKENLWKFCELALTAYAMKKTAEVLGRGGSHMTSNPCESIIKNADEVKRINEIVLPAIFAEIDLIFSQE